MKEAKSRNYDKEFRINAAKPYLLNSNSYLTISRELGIPKGTLIPRLGTRRRTE